jgi:hypothetical protein
MTPDITALVEAAPMPPGFTLSVTPQRKFKQRSLWAIRVLDASGDRVFGRAVYNPAMGIRMAQAWAWAMSRGEVPA